MRIKFRQGRLGSWTNWYDVRPSAYYSDNYNETLGDTKLHIDQVTSEIDVEPFDIAKIELYGAVEVYSAVDNIISQQISFTPDIYTYSVVLIEPTKILENYLISPFSITKNATQSRTILYYAQKFINLAFFNEKAINGESTIPFTIDNDIADAIKNTLISEAQVNNTLTLKEALTNIFMQVDCLPYIKGFDESTNKWIISSRSINTTGAEVTDKHNINYIKKSQSSVDYVSDLQVNMKNATQSENITPVIGFRNSERYIMSTNDLQLETIYPIWDLKHLYLSVYVEKLGYHVTGHDYLGNEVSDFFLADVNLFIKLDLTEFVSEYGLWLTKDVHYGSFADNAKLNANFRNASLYFKRGQKGIHNFQGYQEWKSLFINNPGRWVWQMLMNYFNTQYNANAWEDNIRLLPSATQTLIAQKKEAARIDVMNINTLGGSASASLLTPYDSGGNLKVFDWKNTTFQIDYIPLYNSMLLASKSPLSRNVKQVVDNQTTELVNAEKLTLLEYMKANRLGNKMKVINARYEENDYTLIPQLSQTINGSVIFKRELTIFNDYIEANFYATDNYVLRDYYTGVASKLRTWKTTIGEDLEKNIILKYYGNNNLTDYNQNDQLGNYAMIPAKYANINELYNKFIDKVVVVKTNITDSTYGGNAYFYLEHTITKTEKTLVISFKFKDNATLGKYISNPNGTGGEEQKDYRYVDNYGECNYFRIVIGSRKQITSQAATESAMRDYPKVDISNIENKVFDLTIPYQKDNKEVLQINIQFEYNENANRMVLIK